MKYRNATTKTYLLAIQLQVQAGSEHDVALEQLDALVELIFEVSVTDGLRCLHHLSEQLLEPPHASDDRALKHVGLLAQVAEGSAVAPRKHHVHHVWLEALDVIFFVQG